MARPLSRGGDRRRQDVRRLVKRWQAPPGSVVHGSAHRLDPRRVARAYGIVVTLIAAGCTLLSYLWASSRRTETLREELVRGADMAPLVVGLFLLALMSAGTTKRIFGFGSAGALGYAFAAVALGVGAWAVGRFGVTGAACVFVLGAALGAGLTRIAAGPWTAHAAFAFALVFGARQGLGFSGLPVGLEGDLAISAAALTGGCGFALWPFLWPLGRDPARQP